MYLEHFTKHAFFNFVRFIELERFSVRIHTAYCTFYKILYQKIVDTYVLSKIQDLLKMSCKLMIRQLFSLRKIHKKLNLINNFNIIFYFHYFV